MSKAPLMATPPRSAADWSLRPPSRRPIGVRAPATITEPVMSFPPGMRVCASECYVWRRYPPARPDREGRRARAREAHVTPSLLTETTRTRSATPWGLTNLREHSRRRHRGRPTSGGLGAPRPRGRPVVAEERPCHESAAP
ncbi:hypothetical protein NOCA1250091 [metagenome]|uniref:Uncharacterized protein n=1 Tax=metagenome TaxID=256318 RepID=A0A2P2CK92_9ZZZZ